MKAFLQISLDEVDQNRLAFLWFRNVLKDDFSLIAYKMKRLPFGLPCSPSILMLALYKILILDAERDNEKIRYAKKIIYSLSYMDNLAFSCNDMTELEIIYQSLVDIFSPYGFSLQQFVINDTNFQKKVDESLTEVTPETVKLFGLEWNRMEDTLSTRPLRLNPEANTKRLVLQSIAENFDILNFNAPLLNRARLFMHKLQNEKTLGWDLKLADEQLREWRNISKQVNNSPSLHVERFLGKRTSKFRLISFTDSSQDIYGTVIYLKDLDTQEVKFYMAKNKFVNTQLKGKGIPSLEFQAIILGAECLIGIYKDLTGPNSIIPINIVELQLYTDSMVSLNWIDTHVNKLGKTQQKRSVFVTNRLNHLNKICESFPIKFNFVSGIQNPADHVTRPLSYKKLNKTNYFTGPEFLPTKQLDIKEDLVSVIIPNEQRNGE